MAKATLKIDIWTDGELPKDDGELSEAFAPHLEHIAGLCASGYQEGQVFEEGKFQGWWSVNREDD